MRGRVPAGLDAVAAGLEAVEPHVGVVEERREDADRVGPAADAGDDGVGQPAGEVEHLLAGLVADDRWKSRTIAGNGCGPATVPSR